MKTLIKIAYSENTSSVLADVKIEVEQDSTEGNPDFEGIHSKAKELFAEAQKYALEKTMLRRK